jgi:exodeoxyribonuclease VII large subunit
MYIKTLTVSALNNYIKKVLDNDFILNNSCIKGEISNFKVHSSGHVYFSLKDEFSKINCIMFRSSAENLEFYPEEGMKVIVRGHVSVYSKDGAYQLYCEAMEPDGLGELYIAFQKLKDRLETEGIFDAKHKKEIPKFSKRVGVITSPTGAAVRDIINVTKRRNRGVDIIIYPSLVQGNDASRSVIKGIEYFNKNTDVDVLIIARGGGSLEELWAFNDEKLAYAIYDSELPIVTGIGHETDFTIADFVSDRRASTTSAAAEIVVFNLLEISNYIGNYKGAMDSYIKSLITNKNNELSLLERTLNSNSPQKFIVNEYNNIENLKHILNAKANGKLSVNIEKLRKLNAVLDAHNPLNALKKGYSIVEDVDGRIVSRTAELKNLNRIRVIVGDGSAEADISNVSVLLSD